jgi:hypothetical protein
MRTTALIVTAALALAACSKADQPQVNDAKADLNAAGTSTTAAAKDLASAAANDVKTAGAVAADQTGKALQSAGAKVKAAGDGAGNSAAEESKKGSD